MPPYQPQHNSPGYRLVKVTNPDGSSIEYAYDSMGNRTAVIVDNDTTRYSFDKLNRLETVTDPDGGVTTYTYDANGNRESVTYPNNSKAEYTYDFMNRLTKLFNHKSNGDTISCYTYSLGYAGNRTQVVEHTGRTVGYTYDDTYKLLQEDIDDPDFGLRTISYTYDDVGNRLTKTDNGVTTTYTYDDNDRLQTENLELETINYTYDNNGNTLTKLSATENITYSYDYQNRLIQADDGTSIVEYAYDTDGMRVQKTVDGSVTNFLLDKNRDYSQVLAESDGSGTEIVSYTYGDDLISQKRSSLTSYYHYDGQMSTRQLTDASQEITDGYTYDAFGILLNKFGATVNDYLYTGEQYDPNVGFYYLRARYYNASIGRFLTMDTWPGMQFEPASLHKYLYCVNNPVMFVDPSGYINYFDLILTSTITGLLSVVNYTIMRLIFTRELPELWEIGVVFGFGFALGLGSGLISLTMTEAAALTSICKVLNAALWYGLRYATIEKLRGGNVTAFGFILSAVSAAIVEGIFVPIDRVLNPITIGEKEFIGIHKALSRETIKSFTREFMQFINKDAPQTYRVLKARIKRWIESILEPAEYIEKEGTPPPPIPGYPF